MNKREATQHAHSVVRKLIESYFDVGQPETDCLDYVGGWKPEDAAVLREAFERVADYHARLGRT